MTPKQVKDTLILAVTKNDVQLAWDAIKQIVTQDMYINVTASPNKRQGRYIQARWGDRPCKCGCGTIVQPGTNVWWEPYLGLFLPDHLGKQK